MRNLKYIIPVVNGFFVLVILLVFPVSIGIDLKSGAGVVILISSIGLSLLAAIKSYFAYGGVCK